MSHKLAKQERKQIVASILINAYADGNIEVKGIPNNYDYGMNIIGGAQKMIHGYFIKQALDGKMNANGIVEKSKIQMPTNGQIKKISEESNGKA